MAELTLRPRHSHAIEAPSVVGHLCCCCSCRCCLLSPLAAPEPVQHVSMATSVAWPLRAMAPPVLVLAVLAEWGSQSSCRPCAPWMGFLAVKQASTVLGVVVVVVVVDGASIPRAVVRVVDRASGMMKIWQPWQPLPRPSMRQPSPGQGETERLQG